MFKTKSTWQTKNGLLEGMKLHQKLLPKSPDLPYEISFIEQVELPDLNENYVYSLKWCGHKHYKLISEEEFWNEELNCVGFRNERILFTYDNGVIHAN